MTSILIDRYEAATRAGLQFDECRDVWSALGYKISPVFKDYLDIYRRQDIAKTVVDRLVGATWREMPLLIDTDNEEQESKFETAWKDIAEVHFLRDRFKRADKLACLGRYSAMLFGLANQADFNQPVAPGRSGPDGLLYVMPYHEDNAQIDKYEEDQTSPRYGWPTQYTLKTQLNRNESKKINNVTAHWTRVVHISRENLESDVFGTPLLECIYNLTFDMLKVVGGAAEAYWLLAKAPLQADLRSDARPLTPDEETALKDQIDELQHNMRRVLHSSGLDLKYLNSGTADPRGPFDVLIKLISAATGIPQRVLMGAEAGELASTQDSKNFAEQIIERQQSYGDVKIVRPTADLLIEAGILPEPANGDYEVRWGDLPGPNQAEEAEVMDKTASAVSKFAQSTNIITPGEVRAGYLGLPPENPDLTEPCTHDDDEVDEEQDDETEGDDEDTTPPDDEVDEDSGDDK